MKKTTYTQRPESGDPYENEVFIQLKKNIAENLKRIRAEQELTQEQLAHQCGLAVRQYQALEGETSNATLLTVARLMEGMEVSAGELLDPVAKKKRQT